jgi:hypothetical protein
VASAFGGQRSIQLSYGRIAGLEGRSPLLAEFGREGNTFARFRRTSRAAALDRGPKGGRAIFVVQFVPTSGIGCYTCCY